jgi:hypothetical protein
MTIPLSVKWVTLPNAVLWQKLNFVNNAKRFLLHAGGIFMAFLISRDCWLLMPFSLIAFFIILIWTS